MKVDWCFVGLQTNVAFYQGCGEGYEGTRAKFNHFSAISNIWIV